MTQKLTGVKIAFNAALPNGKTAKKEGHLFTIELGGLAVDFVAHPILAGWAITHYRTGYRVGCEVMTKNDPLPLGEAIQGFRDEFRAGIHNLKRMEEGARNYPPLNNHPTELTPEGEQYVFDGCEKPLTDSHPQGELW